MLNFFQKLDNCTVSFHRSDKTDENWLYIDRIMCGGQMCDIEWKVKQGLDHSKNNNINNLDEWFQNIVRIVCGPLSVSQNQINLPWNAFLVFFVCTEKRIVW